MRSQLLKDIFFLIPTIKQGRLISILKWILGVLIAYGVIIHLLLVIDPQPIEYREGATLHITRQLQSSVNIYDFKRQPYDLNVYGPAYYWFAGHLSPVFGTDFTAHRILSAAFIFASCMLIIWVFRAGRFGVAGLVAAAVWYASTLRLWGIGARPDAMAILLYMLSVFVPWRLGFSRKSIFFSAACSILAFFTKPYFAAGIIYVIGYLLLRGHLRMVALTSVLFVTVIFVLLEFSIAVGDAYLYNTIFVNLGFAGSWNWPHVLDQAWRFSVINLPLLFCLGYAVLASRSGYSYSGENFSPQITDALSDLYYLLFAVLLSLVMLLRLAHNSGSGEYFIHLLSPILLVAAYQFLASRDMTTAILIAGILQVAILLPRFPYPHVREWQEVQSTIAKEARVLHSPSTIQLALARGETVFDSGQTEFFPGGLKRGGRYYPQAIEAWVNFQADVSARAAQKEFSLILLNVKRPAVIERERLRQYYEFCGTLPAPIYRNPENALELWRPSCLVKSRDVRP